MCVCVCVCVCVYERVPVERPVVSDGGDHDDLVGGELPDLIDERVVHEVGAADAQVEHVDLLEDRVVEGVEEPRRV